MNELFIALDFHNETDLWYFIDKFKNQPAAFKIGMSQFYMSGPDIVNQLHDMGHKIFLDLKCHDIPNTVKLATQQLSKLPVELVTVHTLGGQKMLEAAMEGVAAGPYSPKVLGITQLTSSDQEMLNQQMQIKESIEDSVIHLAQLAQKSGVDGVVSSALETPAIKQATNHQLLSLTPGIRLTLEQSGDQTRVATPEQARLNGADYIVVGRPITQANNPVAAYQEFLKQWQGE